MTTGPIVALFEGLCTAYAQQPASVTSIVCPQIADQGCHAWDILMAIQLSVRVLQAAVSSDTEAFSHGCMVLRITLDKAQISNCFRMSLWQQHALKVGGNMRRLKHRC